MSKTSIHLCRNEWTHFIYVYVYIIYFFIWNKKTRESARCASNSVRSAEFMHTVQDEDLLRSWGRIYFFLFFFFGIYRWENHLYFPVAYCRAIARRRHQASAWWQERRPNLCADHVRWKKSDVTPSDSMNLGIANIYRLLMRPPAMRRILLLVRLPQKL